MEDGIGKLATRVDGMIQVLSPEDLILWFVSEIKSIGVNQRPIVSRCQRPNLSSLSG